MTPAETARLIAIAGGDTKFAQLLGIDKSPRYQQRVNNWKRRGIPSAIVVAHYDAIQRLRQSINDDHLPKAAST